MKTALVAVSEKGAALARILASRLPCAESFVHAPHAGEGQVPFENVHDVTRKLWMEYEGLVFLCASGIAVRAIAPLVSSKYEDPAVVVTADNGAYAVSLLSGHEGGANGLAAEVAACIEGTPVISTASEASPNPLPRNLVAGIGCRRGTSAGELLSALEKVFASHRISLFRLRGIASIDLKKDEKGLLQLAEKTGTPLFFFGTEELNKAEGNFSGSDFVKEITGTDNVCERAAALGAGNKGRVIVPKQAMDGITIAVYEKTSTETPKNENDWKRDNHQGDRTSTAAKLTLAGIGPGNRGAMTAACGKALLDADVITGYTAYIELLRPFFPDKDFRATPMKTETARCRESLALAAEGKRVCLVSSGDSGIYGMASLALELSPEFPSVALEIIPGVTAASSGGALLGAPLGHDFVVISLSDLLTPWELIEKRLRAAASGDFVICIYNPVSHKRSGHLQKAAAILLEILPPERICGLARNIGRSGENAEISTLGKLGQAEADMFTTVFVGSSKTAEINGKMVTPRGYHG